MKIKREVYYIDEPVLLKKIEEASSVEDKLAKTYVSLKDIKDAIKKLNKEGKKMEKETTMNILTTIRNLPPADVVERPKRCTEKNKVTDDIYLDVDTGLYVVDRYKKGHWVRKPNGNIECSECGVEKPNLSNKFCYNCGADMRGEDK